MSNRSNTHIHVGQNIPGYLPEGEPACFDDLDSAIEYLRDELKDQQDSYWQSCDLYAGDPDAFEACECSWCDVASDVEAALSAIADGDTAYKVGTFGAYGWRFSPPEGPDVSHWAEQVKGDHESCEIHAEQET